MNNDTLNQLISFPTVTSDLKTNLACLSWCRNLLTHNGIVSRLSFISNRPILTWGVQPHIAHTLITSHIDVVPAPFSSFSPKQVKQHIFGRGSADTKAAVSALLHLSPSLISMAESKKIIFALTSDEEIGGLSNKAFLKTLKVLKFGIFCEPTNLNIVTQAKGIMQVNITSSGKAAHGSRVWLGSNAIINLSYDLQKFLQKHPVPTAETFNTTFNFSLITGGSAINQVPKNCVLQVDIRFNPADDPNNILQELTASFPSCTIAPLKIESPIFCDNDLSEVKVLIKCLKKIDVTPHFSFEHGSSDARHCTTLNIPAIVFGPIGDHLHEDHEWVDIVSLAKFQAALELFIQNC